MPRKAAPRKSVELDRSRTPLALVVVGVVGGLLTAGAIMWGRSDTGMINVTATIANSQHNGGDSGAGSAGAPEAYATQAHTDLPNGGLVPASQGSTPQPPPPPVAEEVASTTPTDENETGESDTDDATASSSAETTEAVPAEENGETSAEQSGTAE